MKQSKAQKAEQQKKRTQEIADMILEHAMIVKKSDQQEKAGAGAVIFTLNSYTEAIQHLKYRLKWKEAIQKKLNSLKTFNTWKIVKQPLNQSVVSCK